MFAPTKKTHREKQTHVIYLKMVISGNDSMIEMKWINAWIELKRTNKSKPKANGQTTMMMMVKYGNSNPFSINHINKQMSQTDGFWFWIFFSLCVCLFVCSHILLHFCSIKSLLLLLSLTLYCCWIVLIVLFVVNTQCSM